MLIIVHHSFIYLVFSLELVIILFYDRLGVGTGKAYDGKEGGAMLPLSLSQFGFDYSGLVKETGWGESYLHIA